MMFSDLRHLLGATRSTLRWARTGYGAPYPIYMKQATLRRYAPAGSVFIETGTYRGQTSRHFAKRGFRVVTIEVHKPLFDRYAPGLRQLGVDARLGDSGDLMPRILGDYAASPAFSFFLDGHYSGGVTGHGINAVPVVREFETLKQFLQARGDKHICIMVDDWRLFMPGGDATYPERTSLLEFARQTGCAWKVENDIFILSNRDFPAATC